MGKLANDVAFLVVIYILGRVELKFCEGVQIKDEPRAGDGVQGGRMVVERGGHRDSSFKSASTCYTAPIIMCH